jgi:hypothetical protein
MGMSTNRIRGGWLSAGVTGVVLAAFSASCGGGNSEAGPPSNDLQAVIVTPSPGAPTALPRKTPEPTPAPTPTPLQVCAPNPDPAPPKVLQVQEPHPEQRVKIPFHIRGWGANIGKDNRGLAVGIVDAQQKVVQVLNLPPQPNQYRLPPGDLERNENTRPFAADIVISGITAPTPFCLWVYQETTPEGRPRGVVQLPIVVEP